MKNFNGVLVQARKHKWIGDTERVTGVIYGSDSWADGLTITTSEIQSEVPGFASSMKASWIITKNSLYYVLWSKKS